MTFVGTGTVVWPPGTHTIQVVVPPGVDPEAVRAAIEEQALGVIVEAAKSEEE